MNVGSRGTPSQRSPHGRHVRKEFAQLRRDRRTVAMLVAVPLLLLIVFGYAARSEVDTARTVVTGPDAVQVPRPLPEVFDVRSVEVDLDDTDDVLRG